jgi:hypothetical protein
MPPCSDDVAYQRLQTLVSHHITTRWNNPEDLDMNFHRRENLKSRIGVYVTLRYITLRYATLYVLF